MRTDSTIANVTLSSTPSLITRQRQNLGSSRSSGIELDGERRLGARWSISAAYLFSDARVIDSSPDQGLGRLRIPQVPRNQATLQLRCKPSIGAARHHAISLGVEARWTDLQYDDDRNELSLPGFVVADAFAGLPLTSRLELIAAAENLFDRRYDVGRTPTTTTGMPRSIRAGLRYRVTQ